MCRAHENFSCSNELLLQVLVFLPPHDLRNCTQVSRSFNRITVQSILDTYQIWDPEQSAILDLAKNPFDLDGLSALLLSIHIKNLLNVEFNLFSVTSLQSALKTFLKIQRLVDRMESVHTVYVHWSSGAYPKKPISEDMLVTACRSVEQVLHAIVTKGCTRLQLGGFKVFIPHYKMKKEPTVALADVASMWEVVRENFASGQGTAASEHSVSLEEVYYCRDSSSSSIGTPRISLTATPKFGQTPKLTTLVAFSANIFRPPFSQWMFSLLEASPITFLTLYFLDLPNDDMECKLILERLHHAVSDVATIHLQNARSGVMKDVVLWLGRFDKLRALAVEHECFLNITDVESLDLQALAHLPHIRALCSSSPFLCAFIASRFSVDAGTPPLEFGDMIMSHMCTPSNQLAVSDLLRDVERLHSAAVEAIPISGEQSPILRISLRFTSFLDSAKAIRSIWDRIDSDELRLAYKDEKAPLEAPPCFRPSDPRPWLRLELRLPSTRDEIQHGVLDRDILPFARMFPTIAEIALFSLSHSTSLPLPRQTLRPESLNKLKVVCPALDAGWLY